jgi:hypothetical protein
LLSLLKVAEQNEGDKLGIFTYVAAKSHRKMLQRLQHEIYSRPFFNSLLGIAPSRANDITRPFPNSQSIDSPLGKRDAAFIESLSQPINEHFLRLSKVGIPKLLVLAKRYKAGSTLTSIYTKETCEEFHRLLCHLLRCYEAALLTLDEFKARFLSDVNIEEFEIAVYGVATCGITLRALAYCSFVEEHFSRIRAPDPLTSQRRNHAQGQMDAEIMYGDEDPELLSERISIQTPMIPAGKHYNSPVVRDAYVDWLRSQVAHFEAANHLIGIASLFRGTHSSMTVIADQDSDTAMRPWQRVIRDVISSSDPSDSFHYTVEDAIVAIEELVSRNVSLETLLKGDMSSGRNFWGTLHSEACLASMIHCSDSLQVRGMDESTVSVALPCRHV